MSPSVVINVDATRTLPNGSVTFLGVGAQPIAHVLLAVRRHLMGEIAPAGLKG